VILFVFGPRVAASLPSADLHQNPSADIPDDTETEIFEEKEIRSAPSPLPFPWEITYEPFLLLNKSSEKNIVNAGGCGLLV